MRYGRNTSEIKSGGGQLWGCVNANVRGAASLGGVSGRVRDACGWRAGEWAAERADCGRSVRAIARRCQIKRARERAGVI
eukprot:4557520-Pleurochrysis_carterae.AAC.1